MVYPLFRCPNPVSHVGVIFTVSILAFSLINVVFSSNSGRGHEFIFAFPTNFHEPSSTSPNYRPHLTLSVTASEAGATNVSMRVVNLDWSRQLTIPAQHVGITVELPPEAQAKGSGLQNTTVLVTASRNVTVLALSDSGESTGGFLVRSTDALGTDYFVVSYTPIVGEWSEFTVTATEDDTVVDINLKAPVMFDDEPYGRETLQLSLNRLQTAQFQSTLDLTGSRVSATRPISVVSGSSASNVPAEFGSAGHVVEHLPPVGAWGTVHALAPLLGRSSGYRCVVVAGCPMTMIRGFGDRVVLASAGDSFEWDASADRVAIVTSSKPILVVQFSKGLEADKSVGVDPGMGGPAMFTVQPIDLVTGPGALLSTPALPPGANHHISVTAMCKDIAGIMLNNSQIVPDHQYEYAELPGFCTVVKRVQTADSSPVISVQHTSPLGVLLAVSVMVHGTGFEGAYALSANLGAEVSPCETAGPDVCCNLEENFQLVSSLSYDEEGSMHSSDYEQYNSIPDLAIALRIADEGTATVQSLELTTAHNAPEPTGTKLYPTPPQTVGGRPTTQEITEDGENPTFATVEGLTVSDAEVTSRPTRASIDSSSQQPITSPTLSMPTTQEALTSTVSTPLESTQSSVSSASPSTRRATVAGTDQPGVGTDVPESTGLLPTFVRTSWIDSTPLTTQTHLSTGPSINDTLSTWLAATLRSTITPTTKEQTTEPGVDTRCPTCQTPFRILLYGGVAMATFILLCIIFCCLYIMRSKRTSKTAIMKRNSRWVAFPAAAVSLDELNLGRMKLKPAADDETGVGNTTPAPPSLTETEDVKVGTGGNLVTSGRTFKNSSS
ncbi:uncharacterized protein LOC110991258 [Acanthaster planci]|uniref:Uncharacterized protein LOC110991258 n=1 Tax=Acanthaster planci TaxID=133434 RepID=A0A8B8A3I7_ACAPL|nr:uncharacterized protein LOC110991258 [Acanthaster planci]